MRGASATKKSYCCAIFLASFFDRAILSRSSRPMTMSAPAFLARTARSPPAMTATFTVLLAAVGSSSDSLILCSGLFRSSSRSLTANSTDWLNFRFSVFPFISAIAFAMASRDTGTSPYLLFSFQSLLVKPLVEVLDELFRLLRIDCDPHANAGACDLFDCGDYCLCIAVRPLHLGDLHYLFRTQVSDLGSFRRA